MKKYIPIISFEIQNCIKRFRHFMINRVYIDYVLVAVLLLFVMAFSIWEGSYTYDPHHWGLMLSNAKDFADGRIPYKDIFIQYGLLTTIVHAVAYRFFGSNLQSLIAVTSAFYALGLLGIYILSRQITSSRKIAFFSFLSCLLLHPLAIYPWSNYIAFPFLVFGVLTLIKNKHSWGTLIFSGALFGAAVLAREGLLVAIVIFLLISSVYLFLINKNKIITLYLWTGFIGLIVLFFMYINISGIYSYWYINSIILPGSYSKTFFTHGLLYQVGSMINMFLYGIYYLNSRIIFISLIILSDIYFIINFMLKPLYEKEKLEKIILSIYSLLLISSSLHLFEIFRFATGITVGAVLFFIIAKKYKVENIFFIVISIFSLLSIFDLDKPAIRNSKGNGNYFYPTQTQLTAYPVRIEIPVFKGQKWSPIVFSYYSAIMNDLAEINKHNPHIKYQYNETPDAFFSVLSPFKQYQYAPFGSGTFELQGFNNFRPDYNLENRIINKDIIIFATSTRSDHSDYTPPKGYDIVNSYEVPESYFFKGKKYMHIVAPKAFVTNDN